MQKTFIKGYVTKAEGGNYRVLASSAAVDRQGDTIDQKGWDLGNFMKNPVMPWAHKYDQLPIAKVTSIETTEKGLECEFEFAPAEGNPVAQQVKVLYDEGFLNAVSVGFIPKERNGKSITKAELLEISFVPVPANQEALRLAMKSLEEGNETELAKALELLKGEVADELDAEEVMEQKYSKFCEVMDVVYAFADVFFDEETPVEDFGKLLNEVAALLQTLAGTGATEEDDEAAAEGASTASFKALIESKGMTTAKFVKFFEIKAGAKLSKSTVEKLDKAIAAASDIQSVLEDLKSSSGKQDGENDDEAAKAVDEPFTITADDIRQFRQSLIATDKTNELSLSIVNTFAKAQGIKV